MCSHGIVRAGKVKGLAHIGDVSSTALAKSILCQSHHPIAQGSQRNFSGLQLGGAFILANRDPFVSEPYQSGLTPLTPLDYSSLEQSEQAALSSFGHVQTSGFGILYVPG